MADDEKQTKITHHFEFMDKLNHLERENRELSDALKVMNAKLQQLKNQSVMEIEGILFVYLYFFIIKLVFNIVVLE